jgi:type II secretory pathway pseudopilin PulG
MNVSKNTQQGMSLVDVVVGVAIMVLMVTAIVGVFRVSINLIFLNKAESGAMALATEQLEFARNLSYVDVGTDSGFITGPIPSSEIITLNDIEYTRETFVEYIDNEKDGLASTTDTIPTDYKRLKTKVSWEYKGEPYDLSLVTNIVPNGSEANVGGGTLSITAIDKDGVAVEGASITVSSDSLSVSETRTTPASGNYRFYGVGTSSDYQVVVTKSGYSTAKTYDKDALNDNPNPGHMSVVDGSTSSAGFEIDTWGILGVYTKVPITENAWSHTFDASSELVFDSTEVISDELRLAFGAGVYAATGTIYSAEVAPTLLVGWEEFSLSDTTDADTDIVYHVHYNNGTSSFALVPDADLPGNSVGFTATTSIDLSTISAALYPALRIGAYLSTNDTLKTPSIQEWQLSYRNGPFPISVPFSLRSSQSKLIGETPGGVDIYKHDLSGLSTDGTGNYSTTTIEWDVYKMTLDVASVGYDIAGVCDSFAPHPDDGSFFAVDIDPDENVFLDISLAPHVSDSLLVYVDHTSGIPVENADVYIENGAYNETKQTDACGQVFFNDASLPSGDTTINVSHATYASSTQVVSVGSRTQTNITLTD